MKSYELVSWLVNLCIKEESFTLGFLKICHLAREYLLYGSLTLYGWREDPNKIVWLSMCLQFQNLIPNIWSVTSLSCILERHDLIKTVTSNACTCFKVKFHNFVRILSVSTTNFIHVLWFSGMGLWLEVQFSTGCCRNCFTRMIYIYHNDTMFIERS